MASLSQNEELWLRGTYYVRSLHPTLEFLKWDYGSLDEVQEKDYIKAKMEMMRKDITALEVGLFYSCIILCEVSYIYYFTGVEFSYPHC